MENGNITTTPLVEGAQEFLPFLRRSDRILDAIDALDFLEIGTEVDRKFGKHFHTTGNPGRFLSEIP